MAETEEQRINREIEFFFQDPKIYVKTNESSSLHLLRRDVYQCLGYVYENGKWVKKTNQVIWPGAMTILTGIDLLGKFYAGNDNSKGVGCRFTDYCKTYMLLDKQNGNEEKCEGKEEEAQAIYQCRNAMIHSYVLFSKDKKRDITYYFQLTTREDVPLIVICPKSDKSKKYCIININILRDRFESSIEKYKNDLLQISQKIIRNNFDRMFKIYGKVHQDNMDFSSFPMES